MSYKEYNDTLTLFKLYTGFGDLWNGFWVFDKTFF